MAIYRFFFTLGSWTFVSRILGFARDVLIASVVGASLVADAFSLRLSSQIFSGVFSLREPLILPLFPCFLSF